jgi:alkanesulfonate monooxygenase SsuD/methylene tetrahydromethanopterin reductase-like flavin-dependent oxidoreductase (luciferase family)
MVDQISKGRLILGVGSGYLMHEFEGFSMSPAQKRERFDETLEVMEKALTGEKFSHAGQFYNLKNVRLNIPTYQQRKLELAIAVLSEVASYYIGKRGYQIMTIPYATVDKIEDLKPIYDNYRKGWAESGNPGRGEILAAVHTHVCDMPAARDELARKHLEKYVYSRLYARHATYDECVQRGVVAMGNPDEVARSLQKIIDTGADHLMFIFNYGAMPLSEVEKAMVRLQKDVLPQLREAPR